MRRVAFLLLIAGCVLGCNPSEPAAESPAAAKVDSAPVDSWVLTATDPKQSEPALLWNGLIGIRVGRDASGTGPDGKPLPFFAIHEYQTEGEEKIVQLPNPLCMSFSVGGTKLDPSLGSGYQQQLDMGTGILHTVWEQEAGGRMISVDVRTMMHPEQRILADQWTFKSDGPIVIEGECNASELNTRAKPKGAGVLVEQQFGLRGMRATASIEASGGADAKGTATHASFSDGFLRFHGAADDGRPAMFQRIYSFGETSTKIDILSLRGTPVRMREGWDAPTPLPSFGKLEGDCATIWQTRWQTDIEIDGPVEDQQAVRSFLFYLRSSIHPDGEMSISPFGLSNQQYNGHIFWDADLWVFPALAFIAPDAATRIPEYRQKLLKQAQRNYQEWVAAGRPTGTKPLGKVEPIDGAAKFPWESSATGKETVPGPSKFEDHISGTVAFSQGMAASLGLADQTAANELINAAGKFYLSRSHADAEGGMRHILGTMSPDEHHVGNDDLYTNLVAMWSGAGGTWNASANAPKYALIRDETGFLTYENDPVRGYKQAAAVLAIFPLQFPPAEAEAKTMMSRFADRVTENGPAMSDSVHATIYARLGEPEKAYSTWHESWKPFTSQPLMLFSEKKAKPITYFTTGAAGSLSAVLYGFLGFRLDSEQVTGAAWSKKLNGEIWLSIKPNLPPAWKSVKFRNFKLQGKSFTLTATPTSTTVAQGD